MHFPPRVVLALLAFSFALGADALAAPGEAAVAAPGSTELDPALDVARVIEKHVEKIFQRSQQAIVRVQALDSKHGLLSGTGFFIEPNGTLYTSYTVAGESNEIVVMHGDLIYPATRLAADPRSGIAILKTEAHVDFIPQGRSNDLKIGSGVMIVGFPLDLPLTPAFGLVAGFDRKYLGRYFATTHVRANIPVQRGQGGSPILNLRGEAVGILISSLDQGSGFFALPIEAAEKIRMDYVRYGKPRPGWLGIDVGHSVEPVSGSVARVNAVAPDAPAEKAGIHAGDIILRVGPRKILTPEDVLDASFFLTAGDSVEIRIARGEQEMIVQLQAGDFPSTRMKTSPGVEELRDVQPAPFQLEREHREEEP